jgi:REP element-mobilizing transposase RayT
MTYWRTYYHIVWATKYREPLITLEVEATLYPAIVGKANELGAIVYALNGTVDHVHLVAAIPPRLAVASVVGEIKGRSSHVVNHHFPIDFAWQVGYGVLTFGEKHLPWVVGYVDRQKEHHVAQTLHARLEVCQDEDNGPPGILPGRAVDGPSGR